MSTTWIEILDELVPEDEEVLLLCVDGGTYVGCRSEDQPSRFLLVTPEGAPDVNIYLPEATHWCQIPRLRSLELLQ